MAKTHRQRAIQHADKWFSKYIRQRDGNRSVLSGIRDRVQCGHIVSRAFYPTRWDENNAVAITAGENRYHEMNPEPLNQWFIASKGLDLFEGLWAKANRPRKFSTDDIRNIGDDYKAKYEALCIMGEENEY
jgi:hypothetical protein